MNELMTPRLISLIFIGLALAGCSDNSTNPQNEITSLRLTPQAVTISVGEETHLNLEIQVCRQPVFGVSMQIAYDNTVLSFQESQGTVKGDFFGGEAIFFVNDNESIIHLTITRIQGQPAVTGSGTMVTLAFRGLTVGNCTVQVKEDELNFYNSAGSEIELPQLEIEEAVVMVG